MRRLAPLFLTFCFAFYGCGGDEPSGTTDLGGGGQQDAATHQDASNNTADGGDAAVQTDTGIDGGMGLPDASDAGVIFDGGDYGETKVPLIDMGSGVYKGMYVGGLYGAGENAIPEPHRSEGIARANAIQPLDTGGQPSALGKYILMSIGMSNTTMEWCTASMMPPCSAWTFTGLALADADVNDTTMAIANGALGSRVAASWDDPADPDYERVRTNVLEANGLSEAQVEIVWLKVANPQPMHALPEANADAYRLLTELGDIVRSAKTHYPNLTMIYLSSRIYAGYATTDLNPEPYAYESGFAVKMLIEAQRKQMADGTVDGMAGDLDYGTVAPWLAWGPYLWADGTNPRSDGLVWERADLDQNDGTHPSRSGQGKVGQMLLDYFKGAPTTKCWFLATGQCP